MSPTVGFICAMAIRKVRIVTTRLVKMTSNFVLCSSKSSTGTRPPHHSEARTDVVLLIRRTVRPRGYACGTCVACDLVGLSFLPTGYHTILNMHSRKDSIQLKRYQTGSSRL